jgi:hypothetical protein
LIRKGRTKPRRDGSSSSLACGSIATIFLCIRTDIDKIILGVKEMFKILKAAVIHFMRKTIVSEI